MEESLEFGFIYTLDIAKIYLAREHWSEHRSKRKFHPHVKRKFDPYGIWKVNELSIDIDVKPKIVIVEYFILFPSIKTSDN